MSVLLFLSGVALGGFVTALAFVLLMVYGGTSEDPYQ